MACEVCKDNGARMTPQNSYTDKKSVKTYKCMYCSVELVSPSIISITVSLCLCSYDTLLVGLGLCIKTYLLSGPGIKCLYHLRHNQLHLPRCVFTVVFGGGG